MGGGTTPISDAAGLRLRKPRQLVAAARTDRDKQRTDTNGSELQNSIRPCRALSAIMCIRPQVLSLRTGPSVAHEITQARSSSPASTSATCTATSSPPLDSTVSAGLFMDTTAPPSTPTPLSHGHDLPLLCSHLPLSHSLLLLGISWKGVPHEQHEPRAVRRIHQVAQGHHAEAIVVLGRVPVH